MRMLYVKYSTLRARQYRIRTQIVGHTDGCTVRKYPAVPEARAHVEAMAENARRIREQAVLFEVPPCTYADGFFEMPYIEGIAMDRLLVDAARERDEKGVLFIVDEYKRLVLAQPHSETDPGAWPAFCDWFGQSAGKMTCLTLGQIDLIFENLVRTQDGRYVILDYEWLCESPVPLSYVFHRAVRTLYLHHRCVLDPVITKERMLERLSVSASETSLFEAWDRKLDERIQGAPGLLPVPAAYLRDKPPAFEGQGKLYYDTGEGFNENQCIQPDIRDRMALRFSLPRCTRVRSLRFDPCEGAYCVAGIGEAWAECESGRVRLTCAGSNAALTEGGFHVFTTQDPQIFFDAPDNGMNTVIIAANVSAPDEGTLKKALEAQNERTETLLRRVEQLEGRPPERRSPGSRRVPAEQQTFLRPALNIKRLDGPNYRATDKDPHFIIPQQYAPGILRVDWSGDADVFRTLRLYYDTGEGFLENGFWEVGRLGTEVKRGHCFLRLTQTALRLRLDPGEEAGEFTLTTFTLSRPSGRAVRKAMTDAYRARYGVTRQGAKKAIQEDEEKGVQALIEEGCPEIYDPERAYRNWIRSVEEKHAAHDAQGAGTVLISVVVPVFETDARMLTEMIESVRAQTYQNWQLCLAEGGSRQPHVRKVLEEQELRDPRIRVTYLPANEGIAGNSNAALALAGGEYVALLDHDDVLAPHALEEVARAIVAHNGPDMVYSDEDKLTSDSKTRFMPHFKPRWDAELLRSCNYITHLFVAKRTLIEASGGFRVGFDGSQDHDLILRVSEKAEKIVHIPRVLYHWRSHAHSTARAADSKDYAARARRLAVAEHCVRIGRPAEVENDPRYGILRVRYTLKDRPFVSVILPDGGKESLVRQSVGAAARITAWDDFEIVVVGQGTGSAALSEYGRARAVQCGSRDRAAMLRAGMAAAKGDVLVLMRPGIEPAGADWIAALYELAQREEAGAVGCLLRYPGGAILHAGIIAGFKNGSGYICNRHPGDDPGYMARTLCAREVSAVSDACMMLKKPMLQTVLDAGGAEETGLCSAIREAGKRIYYTPHAKAVWHGAPAQFPAQGRAGDDPFYSPHFVRQTEPYRIREK